MNQRKPERYGFISDIQSIYEMNGKLLLENHQLRLQKLQKVEEEKMLLNKYTIFVNTNVFYQYL